MDERDRAAGRVGATGRETVFGGTPGYARVQLLHLPGGASNASAIDRLEQDRAVKYAEPNWRYRTDATSNDPYYTNGSLWGMYGDATSPANQYGSQAGEAWAAGATGSNTVYVGVIDEGIDYSHPELSGNVWTNPYDPVNGVDDDGNGYKDDTHGWDFYNNDNTIYDGGTKGRLLDDHGTHVTGTLGAKGGNATGVAGVNWNVTYISGKFLGPNGGYTSDAIRAADYFTDLKTRHGLNIVATNNSWGGGGFSQGLLDAITRGAQANILFVAAAGNDGVNNDSTANYPCNYNTSSGAGYDAVIAVAAIDSSGNLASWSDYGASTVDLGAPGVGIYSTLPRNKYGSYSGTSMATPHVTGAAALYKSTHPLASALDIKNAILNDADPTSSLSDKTVTGDRLDASFTPPDTTPPAAPTGLTATAGNQSAGLDWADNTESDLAGYDVYRSTTSGSGYSRVNGSLVTASNYNDTGLTNGTTYYYVVKAVDSSTNPSGNSNQASATPSTSYSDTVLGTAGLVSYWRLGETSGTTAADSQGTNTGTYTNGVTLGAQSLLLSDTVNKAASFDGSNDYVNVRDAASLDLTSSFTLECWVNLDATTTSTLLRKGGTGVDNYALSLVSGTLRLEFDDSGSGWNHLEAGSLSAGMTYHVVGVFDNAADTLTIYINGQQVGQATGITRTPVTNTSAVYMGARQGSSGFTNGRIDEVAIYSVALSASTVASHFHASGR
jgi:subtilisin family serine protease